MYESRAKEAAARNGSKDATEVTKREHFAAQMLAGMLANDRLVLSMNDGAGEVMALGAVRLADALLLTLANYPGEQQ